MNVSDGFIENDTSRILLSLVNGDVTAKLSHFSDILGSKIEDQRVQKTKTVEGSVPCTKDTNA